MNLITTIMTKINNPDEYYQRSEVSNSDLTELKNLLHPHMQFGDKEAAFRFGSIVDAIITEPSRVDFLHMTIDGEQCSEEEFLHAREMQRALRAEARRDPFLAKVLEHADTQRFMVNKQQEFCNGGFTFHLDTRCKWDWWLPMANFGGDLKTTFASTQAEFDNAVDFFDWDRSRAWYMDIAHSDRDFIYAISKKNCNIFKKFINRGDDIYNRGREKYEELAFQYWAFNLMQQTKYEKEIITDSTNPAAQTPQTHVSVRCVLWLLRIYMRWHGWGGYVLLQAWPLAQRKLAIACSHAPTYASKHL